MPIANPFRRPKAEDSTLDDLSLELGRQDRIRLDAQNTLHDLGARRPALLVDGTDVALAKHDADMAACRRTIEQAEARIAVVEPEWRLADERETAARLDRERRERHASAVKARAEGVKLLAVYRSQAPALAETLRRLVEIEAEIEAANLDLPPDAAPVGGAEPFNGRHATPDVWPEGDVWIDANGDSQGHAAPGAPAPFPGVRRVTRPGFGAVMGSPGCPHQPLAGRVHLPAVALDTAPYWPPRGDHVRLSEAEKLFLFMKGIKA